MVFPFIENGSAAEFFEETHDELKDRRVLEVATKTVTLQLLEAVSFLEKINVINPDLKLENILIERGDIHAPDAIIIRVIDNDNSFVNLNREGNHLKVRRGSSLYWPPEVLCSSFYSKLGMSYSVGICVNLMLLNEEPVESSSVVV